ncbi:hypothetical protein ACN47E_009561 [Coniothyrium glycines]
MTPSRYFHGLGPKPSTPVSPLAADGSDEIATLNHRHEQFKLHDQDRSSFMSEVITRYDFLHQQYQSLVLQRESEQKWLLQWQAEKSQYEHMIKSMQRAMAENPFVTILIDGDGMVFVNEFLREGEQGGRRAASALYDAVQNFIEKDTMDIPLESRLICRIYANIRGLSEVLVRIGVIPAVSVFDDFVRGFAAAKPLFEFIDVGPGKDRADVKIIESFKIFSHDYHCRRVLFGGSHDNGYARTLEQYYDKTEMLNKVVLLEGVPFEKELVTLPYSTKKFPGIFRETKISTLNGGPSYFMPVQQRMAMENSPKAIGVSAGLSSRSPAPGPSPSPALLDSPLPARAMMANIPRTPSNSTLASDGYPGLKMAATVMNSWAVAAAKPPPSAPAALAYRPASREEVIARNRAGQRVDPPCKDYDKIEVDRIKKIKMCNVHFLRKECPFDTSCTHLHAYKPTDQEIATLRLVARMAPCINGSGCQDIKCIYGHCCPAPHAKNHIKGNKPCIFGESCKFPIELHDIDRNVVKTLVVR